MHWDFYTISSQEVFIKTGYNKNLSLSDWWHTKDRAVDHSLQNTVKIDQETLGYILILSCLNEEKFILKCHIYYQTCQESTV
jgi:hypothetical protein